MKTIVLKEIDYNNCTFGQALDALYSDESVTYIACNAEPAESSTIIMLEAGATLVLCEDDRRILKHGEIFKYIADHGKDLWMCG